MHKKTRDDNDTIHLEIHPLKYDDIDHGILQVPQDVVEKCVRYVTIDLPDPKLIGISNDCNTAEDKYVW